MASTVDPRNPTIIARYGLPAIVTNSAEANSQSFKAGELVYSNAGAVTLAVTGASTLIWGRALTDATNVSSGNITIPVEILSMGDELQMKVSSDSTIANFQAANTTCAQGVSYDIVVASNIWFVDSSDTAQPAVVFIDAIYDSAGAATDVGRFRPLASVLQVGVGS
jgi:hypothetical protein